METTVGGRVVGIPCEVVGEPVNSGPTVTAEELGIDSVELVEFVLVCGRVQTGRSSPMDKGSLVMPTIVEPAALVKLTTADPSMPSIWIATVACEV